MAKLSEKDKELICSMALEINDKGKKKYTQQFLADKFNISKGMVNRYVKEKVNISKQIISEEVQLLGDYHNLQKTKSKHLSKHEQLEVNKQIDDLTKHLLFFQNSAIDNQLLANKAIKPLIDKKELTTDDLFPIESHARITQRNKDTVIPKDGKEIPVDDNSVIEVEIE